MCSRHWTVWDKMLFGGWTPNGTRPEFPRSPINSWRKTFAFSRVLALLKANDGEWFAQEMAQSGKRRPLIVSEAFIKLLPLSCIMKDFLRHLRLFSCARHHSTIRKGSFPRAEVMCTKALGVLRATLVRSSIGPDIGITLSCLSRDHGNEKSGHMPGKNCGVRLNKKKKKEIIAETFLHHSKPQLWMIQKR